MKYKYNPFRPNAPVFKGMFSGRIREIERIDDILYQTKYGNPTHIQILGERGIGKSSLLLVANYFAKLAVKFNTFDAKARNELIHKVAHLAEDGKVEYFKNI